MTYAPTPFRLSPTHDYRVAGGHRVVALHLEDDPLAAAEIVVAPGVDVEPISQMGTLSVFARSLMQSGSNRRPGSAAVADLERIGASITARASWDAIRIGLVAPIDAMAESFSLVADILCAPELDQKYVEAARRAGIRQAHANRLDPMLSALQRSQRLVYDDGERYAHPVGGTIESLEALDLATVSRAADTFVPGRCATVLAADLTKLDPIVAEASWQWGTLAEPRSKLRPAFRGKPGGAVLIDGPWNDYAAVVAATPGVSWTSPDRPVALALNAVFGAMFDARLRTRLAEECGVYDLNSGFDFRRLGGPFLLWTTVPTVCVAKAIHALRDETERLSRQPASEDELEAAIRWLIGGLAVSLATAPALASAVATNLAGGLPPDPAALSFALRALDPDQTRAAADRLLNVDSLALVIAARSQAINIGALGLPIDIEEAGTPSARSH